MKGRFTGCSGTLILGTLSALAFVFLWDGSGDSQVTFPPPGDRYCAPTAPESLIANLQVSYRRREIQEYAKILAGEFRFQFQHWDTAAIGKEYWNREEDSTGTGNLFKTPKVSEIRIDLLQGDPELANEIGMPAGAVKIRIIQTDLQVDADPVTLLVTDQQDMFFRRGLAAAGEDTTRWFLFEWRDLPALAGVGTGESPGSVSPSAALPRTWGWVKANWRSTPVRKSTWGRIKALFAPSL